MNDVVGRLTGWRCPDCGCCLYEHPNLIWCSSCEWEYPEPLRTAKYQIELKFSQVPVDHPHLIKGRVAPVYALAWKLAKHWFVSGQGNWVASYVDYDGVILQGRAELRHGQYTIILSTKHWHHYQRGDRVEVFGLYPYYEDGGMVLTSEKRPRITFDGERTYTQLARDIERRFMRQYVALYDRLLEKKEAEDRAKRQKVVHKQAIMDQFGGKLDGFGRKVYRYVGPERSRWEVDVKDGGGVSKLQFHDLDIEEAMELINLYQEMKNEQ